MGGSNHFVMLRDSVGKELGNSKMACCCSQSLGSLWAVTSQLGSGVVAWQGCRGVLGASAGLLHIPAALTPTASPPGLSEGLFGLPHKMAPGSKSKHLKRER